MSPCVYVVGDKGRSGLPQCDEEFFINFLVNGEVEIDQNLWEVKRTNWYKILLNSLEKV